MTNKLLRGKPSGWQQTKTDPSGKSPLDDKNRHSEGVNIPPKNLKQQTSF